MADGFRGIGGRLGIKLIVGAALIATAFQVTGRPVPAPVATPAGPELSVTKPPAAKPAATQPIATPAPADQHFVVKRILTIDHPLRDGDYVWDDAGVPDGPIVITADLTARTLSVFRGGYEIGTAVILFGADDKPTPLGTFPITQKSARHVSSIYGAPMPYMMRLTNDGVAIHGSNVRPGWATNGCIGVPTEFARLLFAQASLGDPVIITDGKMLGLGEPIIAL